jgi:hypothetical protein
VKRRVKTCENSPNMIEMQALIKDLVEKDKETPGEVLTGLKKKYLISE